MRFLPAAALVIVLAGSVWAADGDVPAGLLRLNSRAAAVISDDRVHRDGDVSGSHRPQVRWSEPPHLVVLMSVMRYHIGPGVEYSATAQALSDAEAEEMIAHLTEALGTLTGDNFRRFASVRREAVAQGRTARIVRPGHIVAGRYEGIRDMRQTIGFGGRVLDRTDGIAAGAVLFDNAYDRTSSGRRLLRMHELGHALGYDHTESHPSIMNSRIGTEPTDFDREVARLAFARGR